MNGAEEKANLLPLEVYTLGGLRILRGGEAVTSLSSRKVEALLIYLAVTGRSQPREVLADFLWDDFSQSRAMNNLRVVLSNLRKHLGDYFAISRDAASISQANRLWVDVTALEAHLQLARDHWERTGDLTPESAAHIKKAADLYQGEFLQGFSVRGSRGFDDWVTVERERLHRLLLDSLGKLVTWQLEQGEYTAGIEAASRWLQLDPLQEAAHRQMMLLLAHSGQTGAALRQYETCVQVLDDELGLPPGEETTRLYEMIRIGRLPDLTSKRDVQSEAEREPPFKGLNYFEVEDAHLFFGREEVTAVLVDALRQGRFLAVVGASGSGKSSLVRAGLIPALRGDKPLADGSKPPLAGAKWPIHLITPTAHPLEALAATLTREAESVTATATLMDDLATDPRSLHLYVRKLLSQTAAPRLLLVVDQFEELFTLCRDEGERRAFVENLLAAVADQMAGPTLIVITLRADFYAHCAQYATLRTLLANRQIYIGQMEREALRQAIEGPAHRDGYRFEPGLVDLFLRDVGATGEERAEPGALPLLSHALLETWKRRRGQLMTFAGYSESGGVRGAIAQTAEQVYHQQLTDDEQVIARNILLRLTELGEGTQDTRRRTTIGELIPIEHERPVVEAVLHKLVDARLITTAEGVVEVAHEALIREWPQLREWLDEGREGLRLQRQITEAAEGWQELGQDPGSLYRGARLAQSTAWVEEQNPQLSALERDFLAASQALAREEEERRKARRQRELESARNIAALEKQRADVQAQAAREQAHAATQLRRRGRYLLVALGMASLLAALAAFFGIQSRQSASEAAFQARLALARELASKSVEALEADAELSVLLAVEAVNGTRLTDNYVTAEAEAALYRSLDRQIPVAMFEFVGQADGDVIAAQFSPDGRRILTTGNTSASGGQDLLRLWDTDGRLSVDVSLPGSSVDLATVSPDGNRIATAGQTGRVSLWDRDGNFVKEFVAHSPFLMTRGISGGVSSLHFSPDGSRILTAGRDGAARLWDVAGNLLATYKGDGDPLRAFFNRNGTRVLTAGFAGTARVWDAAGNLLLALAGEPGEDHSSGMRLAAGTVKPFGYFSPDDRYILTSFASESAQLWDLAGNLVTTFDGHTGEIWEASFRPDGKQFVTASVDGTARIWDINGQLIKTLVGHSGEVVTARYSADGRRIVTASEDGTALIWGSEGSFIDRLEGHSGPISVAEFSPDGDLVLTASVDGTAGVWTVVSSLIAELDGHNASVESVAFDVTGEHILSASADGTAVVWDAAGQRLATIQGEQGEIWFAANSHDGKRIITAGDDGSARLWDEDGALIATLDGHAGAVRWAGFSPGEDRIVTTGDGGSARLWDGDGRLLNALEGHIGAVRRAAFRPDGDVFVTVGRDGTPRLWDREGTPLAALNGHTGPVRSLAFSPDGRQLVTGSRDGTAWLWDIAAVMNTGAAPAEVTILEGHTDWVSWVAFSPDGSRIVTAGAEGTARLWDAQGELLATLEGHTAGILWASFSPDGRRIATASEDGTARLWDGNGSQLATYQGHAEPVQGAAFSPDGTRLVTASQDGTARIWNVWLDADAMLAEVERRALRPLTDAECRQYLRLEQCPER